MAINLIDSVVIHQKETKKVYLETNINTKGNCQIYLQFKED